MGGKGLVTTASQSSVVKPHSRLRYRVGMMRHRWWWKRALYWPTLRAWHRLRWGVAVPPSMLAQLGRGRYVDVVQRGPYIEITEHASGEMIRLIPYQPNHGLMVELHCPDGTTPWRTHLDFKQLRGMGIGERKS